MVQRPQDLDALLLAHREVAHRRARRNGKAIPATELHQLDADLAQVGKAYPAFETSLTQDHVLRDGEPGNQLEVLVHHPDAALDRVVR